MTSTPTAAQIRYATKLQADLRDRITWPVDRAVAAAALRPQLPLFGATPEQKEALRTWDADTAIDAWIARREKLASTDLAILDKAGISAWINDAKAAL